ncbi:MAG: hypothetical protein ABFS03_05785 [Chloroflexota bacterium]
MTIKIDFPQPVLFDLENAPADTKDVLPAIWHALEATTSPNVMDRQAGLDQLLAEDVLRVSPLVASVLLMRISEPDIQLRTRTVHALGEVLLHKTDQIPSYLVRQHLKHICLGWKCEHINLLLEVVDQDPLTLDAISALLTLCSQSGKLLSEIMIDRKVPVVLRQQAIDLIGRVGFLEAIPSLERFVERLTSRSERQKKMPFAPVNEFSEEILIANLKKALLMLQTY